MPRWIGGISGCPISRGRATDNYEMPTEGGQSVFFRDEFPEMSSQMDSPKHRYVRTPLNGLSASYTSIFLNVCMHMLQQ